ncbi:MAG: phospholipid carrier-dependent glycosyltransferase [Chloroflexi bacterium]|nr:DUF2298 domain-containing protein [Chloroflexota bacterium]MQC26034.1 phospholipid carrier-dependent glycosyltransferase [Chloroflexota bacterium]
MIKRSRIYDLIFLALILVAAFLRTTGIRWDAEHHLHPDERFLAQVESALIPVEKLGDYFNTATSTLNPNNRGFSFFVYGTLPIIAVRYVAEWLGQTGYDQVHIVGRALSAVADLGVIFLVYLIAIRLFDKRVGLLAAAFSAFTVVQIQQSHYFTVDNFLNFFIFLALYFAIRIAGPEKSSEGEDPATSLNLFDFVAFGIALGMAMASKVSAAPLALMLPAALILRLWQLPNEQRKPIYARGFAFLAAAGAVSFLIFRIFQPYAFAGPSFFNVSLNSAWLDTLSQLRGQATGDIDWPPSMQWARRPIWFAFENMARWGMGLPLAIVAWGGFLWAAWVLIKRGWNKPELLLWAWGALYFVWQSVAFNPTMRYLLPVYPVLAVFGAWALFRLWDEGAHARDDGSRWRFWARPVAILLAAVALLGSAVWSFAFVRIYQQPVTRIAASRWIYENVPGPITLTIETAAGPKQQQVPYRQNQVFSQNTPYFTSFRMQDTGTLEEISLYHVLAPIQLDLVSGQGETTQLVSSQGYVVDWVSLVSGSTQQILFPIPIGLPGPYQLTLNLPGGGGQLRLDQADLMNTQDPAVVPQSVLQEIVEASLGDHITLTFDIFADFPVDQLVINLTALTNFELAPLDVHIALSTTPEMGSIVAEADGVLHPESAARGFTTPANFRLSESVSIQPEQVLYMQIDMETAGTATLLGAGVVSESSWDDGIPLRLDGYDPFGGVYQGGLNFEMYWDEDATKLNRFLDILDRGEYLFVTSSRQWASLPRIPERFPLVTEYYRLLLGCPEGQTIESCFNVAQLGDFEGRLGYELVQIFDSSPQLNSLVINDQVSEEAFTVYDHPKVFIFKKSADYDQAEVVSLLSAVNLDNVIHLTPKQATGPVPLTLEDAAGAQAPNLMLPEPDWERQRAGGTWSQLFDVDNWINTSSGVSALIWYLALAVLGFAAFPMVRWAMPGLQDHGYPLARLAGLLLLSYFAWLGASLGLSFTRGWLAAVALLLILAGAWAAYRQRVELRALWERKRHLFMRTEVLFFAFFILMLLIRWFNPDLWHPGKGGEKPMDFAYFNAVLKSTSFPAYDPWFAGGYINYYYYGFVLVGSLTKLLGIIPSVAYNLILPSLFAMLALGAYSLASNLYRAWKSDTEDEQDEDNASHRVGILAAIALVLAGNLGSLQMIFQGFMRLGSDGAYGTEAGLITGLVWTARGLVLRILGQPLPFGLGDWYWNPTRIIPAPGESAPITEFPLFTFTYADLHAHMIALPLTLLALAWALSVVLSRAWRGQRAPLQLLWVFLFGGIAIGSLRPTNTWDLPTYLVIAAFAVAYAIGHYFPPDKRDIQPASRWLYSAGGIAAITFASILAYQPYAHWYRQGFTSLERWAGSHTPSGVYLLHWGIMLFFILAWMLWETRQWLASTPLSSLRKLKPYQLLIYAGLLVLLAAIVALTGLGVHIAWFVLPLMLWAGLLILRPGQPESKRLVLFLVGTGLFLTLMVEVVVLRGDISRMNTVFKFYMQVWTLFALSATLALAWTFNEVRQWLPSWQRVWVGIGAVLIASGALFLVLAVPAKMKDRMSATAPHTLDGLAYMQTSVYYERDQELDLNQDYVAIRWLQDNVEGSPVIVEAHTGEYRWGSRYAINTGLPAVIGWNWHQRQQREFVPGNDIWGRVGAVQQFYETSDLAFVNDFLQTYDVEYVIVGQLERAYYPGSGLGKFERQDGRLWEEVFRFEDTVIYRANASALTLD